MGFIVALLIPQEIYAVAKRVFNLILNGILYRIYRILDNQINLLFRVTNAHSAPPIERRRLYNSTFITTIISVDR